MLYWRYLPQWAIRDGDWKLLQMRGGETPQLFDLAKDVGEKSDLATAQPDVVKKLKAKYDAWNAQLMDARWPRNSPVREDDSGAAAEE